MTFGSHVDNAIRFVRDSGEPLRTDVSTTLFLSEPDEYEGGELVVEETYGAHKVKLPAGDAIVYPATSLHHVTPITRGSRGPPSSGRRASSGMPASGRCCSTWTWPSCVSTRTIQVTSRRSSSPASITTSCANGRRRSELPQRSTEGSVEPLQPD